MTSAMERLAVILVQIKQKWDVQDLGLELLQDRSDGLVELPHRLIGDQHCGIHATSPVIFYLAPGSRTSRRLCRARGDQCLLDRRLRQTIAEALAREEVQAA
jgi:hypothetical protein